VIRKPFRKNQEAILVNVQTFEKFQFPIIGQYGEIDKVYVAAPGVVKYNHTLNKTFITIDLSKEKLEKIAKEQ
jgi:hypothetical protein